MTRLRDEPFDLVIVGGGTVGLTVAAYIESHSSLKTVLLEKGEQNSEFKHNEPVEFTRSKYEGYYSGRRQGLGGTSAIWGGAMTPYLPKDFGLSVNDTGNILVRCLNMMWFVERFFGLPNQVKDVFGIDKSLSFDCLTYRRVVWPKFKHRNAYANYRKLAAGSNAVEIISSSFVENIVRDAAGYYRVTFLKNQESCSVLGKNILIASGAIESTLLLQKVERSIFGCIKSGGLGSGLHDHVSKKIASIELCKKKAFFERFILKFDHKGMTSGRLEIGSSLNQKYGAYGFVHFALPRKNRDVFDNLRALMKKLQGEGGIHVRDIIGILGNVPWLLKLCLAFAFNLNVPPHNNDMIELHLVTSQLRSDRNNVSIEFSKASQLQKISWSISDEDENLFRKVKMEIIDFMNKKEFKKRFGIKAVLPTDCEASVDEIFHPVGTIPIEVPSVTGVLDENAEHKFLKKFFVASTAVIPFCGGASATMQAILIGLDVARSIALNEAKLNTME